MLRPASESLRRSCKSYLDTPGWSRPRQGIHPSAEPSGGRSGAAPERPSERYVRCVSRRSGSCALSNDRQGTGLSVPPRGGVKADWRRRAERRCYCHRAGKCRRREDIAPASSRSPSGGRRGAPLCRERCLAGGRLGRKLPRRRISRSQRAGSATRAWARGVPSDAARRRQGSRGG